MFVFGVYIHFDVGPGGKDIVKHQNNNSVFEIKILSHSIAYIWLGIITQSTYLRLNFIWWRGVCSSLSAQ